MSEAVVGILMGSDSDFPVMKPAFEVLKNFDVKFRVEVASAHRTPAKVEEFTRTADEQGIKVILAAAGAAAHLAGVVASQTTLPVLGIPIDATSLNGLDSILSIAQMPAGIPVGTLAIGKAGAQNAALLAISILALSDSGLSQKLKTYREEMKTKVEQKSDKLKAILKNEGLLS